MTGVRRLLGVVLVAAVALLLAAGCRGEDRDPAGPPAVQQTSQPEVEDCDLGDLLEGDEDCDVDVDRPKTPKPKSTVKRDTKKTKAPSRSTGGRR